MAWQSGFFFHDLWLWIVAVVWNWATVLTGGLLIASVTQVQLLGKSIPKSVGYPLSLLFLLLAFFNSWRAEYLKTSPGLDMRMAAIDIGQGRDGAMIAIPFIKLANLGPPTTADGWELLVQPSGYVKPFVVSPTYLGNDGVAFVSQHGSISWTSADMIYSKTSSDPIPTGGKRTGLLAFKLPPEVDKSTYRSLDTKYTLRCVDVSGNQILSKTDGKPVVLGDSPGFVPGLGQPSFGSPK